MKGTAVYLLKALLLTDVFRKDMAWNFEYKGCYRDGFPRDLEGGKINSRPLTLQNCHSRCQPSFLYFGLQFSEECFCGNSYGKYGKRAESECNMPCRDNTQQICGAGMRNSIYETVKVSFTNADVTYGSNSAQVTCHGFRHFSDGTTSKVWTLEDRLAEYDEGCVYPALTTALVPDEFFKRIDPFTKTTTSLDLDDCSVIGVILRLPSRQSRKHTDNRNMKGITVCLFAAIVLMDVLKKDISMAYVYIGCFKDGTGPRDLVGGALSHKSLTLEMCRDYCKPSFLYFAGQFSLQCYCDNSYGRYWKLSESLCNMACSGNAQQMCGSGMVNSIYATHNVDFANANVIHGDGSYQVVCHPFCSFADNTKSKDWTVQDQLLEYHQGCICKAPVWDVDEPWWSHLKLLRVSDNDTTTCLEFKNGDPVLTLLQETPLSNTFTVEIILGKDHHHAAIRVLTSETDDNSCSQPKELKQCQRAADNKYHCLCELNCQVSVKLIFMSHAMAKDEVLTICEIILVF